MQSYQQRVIEERNELKDKMDKLSAFIGTQTYQSLSKIDNYLLYKQLEHMTDYYHILELRISLF